MQKNFELFNDNSKGERGAIFLPK